MSEIRNVHQKIEDAFVNNLQDGDVKPAAAEELICILSESKNPKPADLLEFYARHSNDGAAE